MEDSNVTNSSLERDTEGGMSHIKEEKRNKYRLERFESDAVLEGGNKDEEDDDEPTFQMHGLAGLTTDQRIAYAQERAARREQRSSQKK
ncbi:MAG: hypothetical protein Q9188_004152 [Gyalolechia gomerana]